MFAVLGTRRAGVSVFGLSRRRLIEARRPTGLAEQLEPRRLLSGLVAYPVANLGAWVSEPALPPEVSANGEAFVTFGSTFYQSDGTPTGTASIGTGVGSVFNWDGSVYFGSSIDDTLVFAPGAPSPVPVRDANGLHLKQPHNFVALGDQLYFAANGSSPNPDVYVTKAGSQTARLVHDGTPIGVAGRALIFWTSIHAPPYTASLWRTDGTDAGTAKIMDGFNSADFLDGQSLGDDLLFNGPNGLWKTDGTADGTVQLQRIPYYIREWEPVGDAVYFMAPNGTGSELWKTDGTAAGTVSVGAMYAGTGFYPQTGPSMVHLGSTLYFVSVQSGISQLFATQGPGTTHPVTLLDTNANDGIIPGLAAVGDKILFSARTAGLSYELWQADGTPGGTTKVPGVQPFSINFAAGPLNLLGVGGSLFFTQLTPTGTVRLWRYGVAPSVVDENGVLVVSGTDPAEGVDGNDVISVTADTDIVTSTVNGESRSFALSSVRRIAVNGLGGDDDVTVAGLTAIPLTLNGGDGNDGLSVVGTPGNDTLTVTSSPNAGPGGSVHTSGVESLSVDTLAGDDAVTFVNPRVPVTFHGGAGNDKVAVDDIDRSGEEDYGVTDASVTRFTAGQPAPPPVLTYDGVESVALGAGGWINVIDVTPSATTAFAIEGNDPGPQDRARDRLVVTTVGATGTHHEPGGQPASGRWTFDNRLPVSYSGVEQTDDGVPLTADIVDVSPDPRKAPVPEIRIRFSEPVTGFDAADLRLTRSGGASNLLTAQQTLTSSDGGVTWTLGNLAGLTTADGVYTLDLLGAGTGISDAVGSPLAEGASDTFTVDNVAPTVNIEDVTPDPRTAPVDFVRIVFSEPVADPTAGRLSLSRNGGINLLTSAQTLTQLDARTYALNNLAALTRPAGSYTLRLDSFGSTSITDLAGNKLVAGDIDTWQNSAVVQGHGVFYNASRADGGDPAANAGDDAGIAPDKQVLLPGRPATFANYSSYDRGINGLMIDVLGLPGDLTPSAFVFEVGTRGDPNFWPYAPAPSAVAVRRGAGVNGSDRVTITWADGSIRNEWIEVHMMANVGTGLKADDVFYFGNLIGDTGGTGSPAVDVFDLARTRAAAGATDAARLNRFDINRDGAVNTADVMLVRDALGHALPNFAAPATPAAIGGVPRGPTFRLAAHRRSEWDAIASLLPSP